MIEHLVTWTCDGVGCGTNHSTKIWLKDGGTLSKATTVAMAGWTLEERDGVEYHYCPKCVAQRRQDGEDRS